MVEIEGWQTVDERGIKMPWLTRPCLEWLNTIDFNNKSVFEYGVGYSTLWFKSRGAQTFGVDHDPKWSSLADVGHTTDKAEYIKSILIPDRFFDFIIIDGEFRDECITFALSLIKEGGFIIIDNYKQSTADLPEWPITEEVIKDFEVMYYPEPKHEDWLTIVIHV